MTLLPRGKRQRESRREHGGAAADDDRRDESLDLVDQSRAKRVSGERRPLRSSGDENADRIRRRTVEATAPILLRAQIALATMLGLVVLRTSAVAEPIASADHAALSGPLDDVFRALFDSRA